MELRERLLLLAEHYNLSIREFEKECGLKRGNISNMTGAIGSDKLSKIIDRFNDVNLYWLISGIGTIFNTKSTENVTNENSNINSNNLGNIRKVQKTLPNEDENYFQYEKYRKCEQINCSHECSQNCSTTKSIENVSNGIGTIFNTKSTENVIKQNDDKVDDIIDDKRKVQKTSSNENEIIFNTKSTENVLKQNEDIIEDIIEDKRKVQKTSSNESTENYLSHMTNKEIEDLFADLYESQMLEDIEKGRFYPAIIVTNILEEKEHKLMQAQQEIGELKGKLRAYEPPTDSSQPNAPRKHK